MSDLRDKLIRLAQEKPELRPHLLPILVTAVDKGDYKKAYDSFEAHAKKFTSVHTSNKELNKLGRAYQRELSNLMKG